MFNSAEAGARGAWMIACTYHWLNKTEPATFSVLLCWAFFQGSIFFCIFSIDINVSIYLKMS